MFFENHLKFIKLNEVPVDFSKLNISRLLQSTYDSDYVRHVYSLPVVSASDVRTNTNLPFDGPVRIVYHTKDAFKRAAKLLGLMNDFKSGVPRTGYRGIVSLFYNGRRVYLAPNSNWKGYDLTWSWHANNSGSNKIKNVKWNLYRFEIIRELFFVIKIDFSWKGFLFFFLLSKDINILVHSREKYTFLLVSITN